MSERKESLESIFDVFVGEKPRHALDALHEHQKEEKGK